MYQTDLVHVWMCTLQHSGRRQLVDEIAQFNGKLGQRLWGSSRCRRLWKGAGKGSLRSVCKHPWAIYMWAWGSWQWALAWAACWASMHGACMLCCSRTPAEQCMLYDASCMFYNAAHNASCTAALQMNGSLAGMQHASSTHPTQMPLDQTKAAEVLEGNAARLLHCTVSCMSVITARLALQYRRN